MSTYSPAKRGITNDHREEQHPRGITPAYAGKTQFEPLFHLLPKEHPRPYGENHIDKLGDAVKEGTSLLVRGIHLFILVTSYTPGITPTHTWNPLRIRDYHACTIASLNHLWILSFFGSDAVSRFSVYSGRIFLDRLSRFHDDVLYP